MELSEFCQQNNISIIDLTTLVRERMQNETEQIYFEDSHLTKRGNEIVAEILANELKHMMPDQ